MGDSRRFDYQWAKMGDSKEGDKMIASFFDRTYGGRFEQMLAALPPEARILDVGCGSGRFERLFAPKTKAQILAFDPSDSVEHVRESCRELGNVSVMRSSLEDFRSEVAYDLVVCVGVAHAAENPEKFFQVLAEKVAPRGELFMTVLHRKNAVKNGIWNSLRKSLEGCPQDELWEVARLFAEAARAIGDGKISMPDVPVLGLKAGEYPIQRLLNYYVLPMYWNPKISYEENVGWMFDFLQMENYASFSVEEVDAWFRRAGMTDVEVNADPFSVNICARGKK